MYIEKHKVCVYILMYIYNIFFKKMILLIIKLREICTYGSSERGDSLEGWVLGCMTTHFDRNFAFLVEEEKQSPT